MSSTPAVDRPTAPADRGTAPVDRGAPPAVVLAIGLAVGLVVVAIARLALFGWAGVAPDDARYVFVGLSTLDGHGPITPTGNLFLLRSPVYGIALAVGSSILGGEPIAGARIVAVILTLAGLLAAVRFAWLLAGPTAGAGTVLALLAMPLIWRLLPTLRVDLPQTAGVVAVLLAMHRPTARRWVLAGAVFGLTVLVKETILPLALAPLAFASTIPRARLARLWGVFLIAAAAVGGWWWILVWTQSGALFPLNAVGVIERRDVGSDLRLDTFGVALLGLVAAAWVVVVAGARRDRGLRLLLVAAACLVPAAAYATLNGLNARNYAGLAVLSAIALGVAAAKIPAWPGPGARVGLPTTRVAALVLTAVIGFGGATAGQIRVGDPGEPALPGLVAGWLRTETPAGGHVVMTFRYSEIVSLELYGHVAVPGLAAVRVEPDAPLSDLLWIGLRDRQLFGYPRTAWAQTLGQPGTSELVLAGPHPLTPGELVPTLDHGGLPGLALAQSFEADGDWATIYRVDPTAVRASPADVALHLSPEAAMAWLDLTGGVPGTDAESAAIREMAQTGAAVIGPDRAALTRRLAGSACLVPLPNLGPDAARVVPAGSEC